MKRLVIVVVVLGVLSAAAATLAASGRPITEKVHGAASIRSAGAGPGRVCTPPSGLSHPTTTPLPERHRESRGRAPHEPLSVERWELRRSEVGARSPVQTLESVRLPIALKMQRTKLGASVVNSGRADSRGLSTGLAVAFMSAFRSGPDGA